MALIFAHRGASGHFPENTRLAFEKALDADCDGIELDVHLTKDDKLVVCHDFTLNRTTNGSGYIKSFNLEDLQGLDAGSWKDPSFSSCTMPTLEEVMDMLKGTQVLLNIELKAGSYIYPGIEEKILEMIKKHQMMEQCMLSSFDHHSLVRLRELSDEVYTGVLYQSHMIEPWLYCEKLKGNALHPYYMTVTEDLLRSCYQRGIEVNTYTANTFEEVERLHKNGIDVIITNYPEFKKRLNNE